MEEKSAGIYANSFALAPGDQRRIPEKASMK
jgi:hypothetical protein